MNPHVCNAGAEQRGGQEATVSAGQTGCRAATEAARSATGPSSAGGGAHTGDGITDRGGAAEAQAGRRKKEWRVAQEASGGPAEGEEEPEQAARAAPAGQPAAEGKHLHDVKVKIIIKIIFLN